MLGQSAEDHRVLAAYGQWALVRRTDGRLVGQVGFMKAMREIGADFDAAPECGWVLAGEAQGQGFGFEAVVAMHRWFDAHEAGGRCHAMIDREHAASLHVAGKTGNRVIREAEVASDPVVLLACERGAGAV